MDTPSKRIDYLIKHYGMSYNAFAKSIGMANGTGVKAMIDNNRTPQQHTLNRLSNAYPEVNIHWIRTGVGEMLSVNKQEQDSESPSQIRTMLDDQREYVEKVYKSLIARLDEDRLHYIKARVDMNKDLEQYLRTIQEKHLSEDRLFYSKEREKMKDEFISQLTDKMALIVGKTTKEAEDRQVAVLEKFSKMKNELGVYAQEGTNRITDKIESALKENSSVLSVAIEKILQMEQDLETITLVLASEYELDKMKTKNKKTNGATNGK